MATSVNVGFVPWADGSTYSGLILRTFDAAANAYTAGSSSTTAVRGGALPAGGCVALQVNAASGMNITVNPGYCVIPNSTSSIQGAYRLGLTTQATLTVPTSDPTNARIDIVVAQVTDNGDATSFGQVELVSGTPSGSPVAPTAPANSIPLAQIAVGAGVSTIAAGNITDQRIYTVPPGGILPVSAAASAPTGQAGSYIHDLTVGRLAHNTSTGVKQVHLMPFAPVVAVATANVTSTGTEVQILSATFTADGSTDVEITYRWSDIYDTVSNLTTCYCNLNLYMDGVAVDSFVTAGIYNTPVGGGGFTTFRTTSALSNTPTAGSHTVAWKMKPNNNSGHSIALVAGATYPAQLVIKPVCL